MAEQSYTHIDWHIVHFDDVPSTQDSVKSFIDSDASLDKFAVYADIQTSGRGRHGREWSSPKGNLYTTLAIKPQRSLSEFGLFAYVAALALYDAVAEYQTAKASDLALKWPNDLMLNDKKAAGILMEHYSAHDDDYLLVGMGVNLKEAPEGKAAIDKLLGSGQIDVDEFYKVLLGKFDLWRSALVEKGARNVLNSWQERAWRLDQTVTAKLGKEQIVGRFDSIDDIGSMIIQLENGEKRRITAGQLYFGNEETGE